MKFLTDWDALTALFKCNQYRHDAQRRYDEAKRDLRDAKEIQAEILDRIDRHVVAREAAGAQKAAIDSATSADGLRDLRESLGMDEFGKKPKDGDESGPPGA